MSEVIITSENFEEEVIKSDIPVLVDFFATWCSPCSALSPIIAEIAEEYAGKVKVGKVNVDEQSALARRFRIMSIPALVFFRNGEVYQTLVGSRPKEEIIRYLK
jgi:thioredoxin 1